MVTTVDFMHVYTAVNNSGLFILANLLYIKSALCGIFYFKKVVKWCKTIKTDK